MISYKISAPGTIILTGEHSAAFGRTFITTSLDCRTRLEFSELSAETQHIEIDFPDVNLQTNIPLEIINDFVIRNSSSLQRLEYVKFLITANCMWRTYAQRNSLEIFLIVFYIVMAEEFGPVSNDVPPFRVTVSTEIPMCAGFGSSTSFTVCLVACFLRWQLLRGVYRFNFAIEFFVKTALIAQKIESILHNEFSTTNVAVCVFGGILKCRLNNYSLVAQQTATHIHLERMKILLINSNNRQIKHRQVLKKMIQLKSESPDDFLFILYKLNRYAKRMFTHFQLITSAIAMDNRTQQENCYNSIKNYICKTQELLTEYDLSSEAFDNIASTATNMEYAAKLTGFGPRYAYMLLPPYIRDNEIETITTQFQDQNFVVTQTTINVGGMVYHV
ncbi:mevalonate kinase-like [Nylanderia fulva]|uniref:mevalonate kinase-like n=1 Tax=Nylanderia fulva TaxID=613905 RepID=UPI0010FB24D8|nr:mevalonate kinase-like [Nylanderia fulva]